MTHSIESRVSAWKLSAESRVNSDAVEDFTADSARVPSDYSALSARATKKWGAIYSAFWSVKTGAKVKKADYGLIGANYHLVKEGTDAEIEAVLTGLKAEEASRRLKAEETGETYADLMAQVAKLMAKAEKARPNKSGNDSLKAIKASLVKVEKTVSLLA